jgi:hypothetical protein
LPAPSSGSTPPRAGRRVQFPMDSVDTYIDELYEKEKKKL